MTYKIVRFFHHSRRSYTIATSLTLEQAHCNDPETSSRTATSKAARARTRKHGEWFDGYYKE